MWPYITRHNGSLKGIISDVLRSSQKHVQIVHVVTDLLRCSTVAQTLEKPAL